MLKKNLMKMMTLLLMSLFLNNCASAPKTSLNIALYKTIKKYNIPGIYRSQNDEFCSVENQCFFGKICLSIEDFNSLVYNYLKE